MVMGGFKLGDIKIDHELEAQFIVLQAPLSVRTDMNRLLQLPIVARSPAKLFLWALLAASNARKLIQRSIHKDLRSVEYVTGEVTGRWQLPSMACWKLANCWKTIKHPMVLAFRRDARIGS